MADPQQQTSRVSGEHTKMLSSSAKQKTRPLSYEPEAYLQYLHTYVLMHAHMYACTGSIGCMKLFL